jgi:hypothetical protein
VQPRCLPAGHVSHAIQIAEAIKATGLGCDTADLTWAAIPRIYRSGVPTSDQVDCQIGNDLVTIFLFPDHAALLTAQPEVRHGVCLVNATHPENFSYVQGENWVLSPESKASADRMAQALHASVQTLDCPLGAKP